MSSPTTFCIDNIISGLLQIQKWSKGKNSRKEIKLDESKLSSPTTLGKLKLAAFGQKVIKLDESKLSSPTTFCIDNIRSGYKLLQILKWLWNGCFFFAKLVC